MSEATDKILCQSTADMWSDGAKCYGSTSAFDAERRGSIPRASAKKGIVAVAGIAVAAMTLTAEAHHRRHSRHVAAVMCDNSDLMRPCYGGYQVDRPQYAAPLARARHTARHRTGRVEHVASAPETQHEAPAGRGVVKASTGAVAYVNERARDAFQCFVDKLETAGVRIKEMGGWADHGHIPHSYHYRGLAMDVNQISRNVTSPPMPKEETFFAHTCGLTSGAEWHNADSGHVEMHLAGVPNIRFASSHHHHHRHHYVRRHHYIRYAVN